MNRTQLQRLIGKGESEMLELKKSTGDLRGGMSRNEPRMSRNEPE